MTNREEQILHLKRKIEDMSMKEIEAELEAYFKYQSIRYQYLRLEWLKRHLDK